MLNNQHAWCDAALFTAGLLLVLVCGFGVAAPQTAFADEAAASLSLGSVSDDVSQAIVANSSDDVDGSSMGDGADSAGCGADAGAGTADGSDDVTDSNGDGDDSNVNVADDSAVDDDADVDPDASEASDADGSATDEGVSSCHLTGNAEDAPSCHPEQASEASASKDLEATAATAQAEAATAEVAEDAAAAIEYVNMYRLYNPNSGEHFYTSSLDEATSVTEAGWRYEGVGWVAPKSSAVPVYRLYNPNAGDHHYTQSLEERNWLISLGWNDEGIGWYSDESGSGIEVLRQYNPNAVAGAHNFTTSSDENDNLVSAGWIGEGIAWYASNVATQVIAGRWIVTSAWGSLERYWLASDAAIATNRLITAAEAGYNAYATATGSVLRSVWDSGSGYVYLADNDGLLACGVESGWLVTGAYTNGELQRYYIDEDTKAAVTSYFSVDGRDYYGIGGVGYVLRGIGVDYAGKKLYANNDGWLESWWVSGSGISNDVHNALALAKLAIRVAVTCEPDERLTAPDGDYWATCDDERAQEYFTICEKSTKRYDWTMGGDNAHHENVAYASCAQAVAMIVRATVDPDMWMIDSADLREYCASSSKWDEVGTFYGDATDVSWLEPGDILCDVGNDHTALYVGNDLVRMKYSDSTANVYEAHSSLASYPELATGTMGSYTYVVYRFNGTIGADLAYFNPWKLLAGDSDWDNTLD